MSELPYMPSHVSDELAKTGHLTNEELGAFRRLTLAMWAAGGYLPDDGKQLARFSRTGKRWGAIGPAIMAMMTVGGGKVSYTPLLATLDLTRSRRQHAAEMGVASGQARRGVDKLVGRGGNQRSDSHPKYEEKGRLNSSKSLITNNPTSSAVQLESSNHNHNKYSSSLVGASKRLSEERKTAESIDRFGTELLMNKVGHTELAARAQIGRWLKRLDGDAEELAKLLAAADQFNLKAAPFVNVVDAGVATIEAERSRGLALPFGLQEVSKANG